MCEWGRVGGTGSEFSLVPAFSYWDDCLPNEQHFLPFNKGDMITPPVINININFL